MSEEAEKPEPFSLSASRGFDTWLASTGGSLAFTTYQAGKVFFIGLKPDRKPSIFERSFSRSMGLAVSEDCRTLLLATQHQLYRFDNVLPTGTRQGDFDALYAPKATWITGDADIHEVAFNSEGRPVFVNTLFNCLATIEEGYSFRPIWRPPFISKLVAEDRCHLNGLAMRDGEPAYVTCVSRSDVTDGWRDRRSNGGVIVDVQSNQIVAEGLSMPHSPRWYRDRLWVLNSGAGEFGWIDSGTGEFQALAFCPGFSRGLSFVGDFAVIGLSQAREDRTFQGLPLDAALKQRDAEPRCGLLVVDLNSGDTVAWIRIEGIVRELFDVAFLPGVICPSAIGLKGDEIHQVMSVNENLPPELTGGVH